MPLGMAFWYKYKPNRVNSAVGTTLYLLNCHAYGIVALHFSLFVTKMPCLTAF